jgi:Flp pilus assembly protein TadG
MRYSNRFRSLQTSTLGRFARDEDGTTAIEFAMVIGPFLFLLFGIISVGFYFFVTFSLEHAVESASRVIRTGQAQDSSGGKTPLTVDTFKAKVCEKLPPFIACGTTTDKIRINVQTYTGYSTVSPVSCLNNTGQLIAQNAQTYAPGGTNAIVLVGVCYEWELSKSMASIPYWISPVSARMNNGSTLIQAATTFTNEPF